MAHHDGAGQKEELKTAREWAKWASLGDPYAKVPETHKDSVNRMETAIKSYHNERLDEDNTLLLQKINEMIKTEKSKKDFSYKNYLDMKSLSMALIFALGAVCEYHTGSGLGFALVAILFIA